jgi:hypothetical protein
MAAQGLGPRTFSKDDVCLHRDYHGLRRNGIPKIYAVVGDFAYSGGMAYDSIFPRRRAAPLETQSAGYAESCSLGI